MGDLHDIRTGEIISTISPSSGESPLNKLRENLRAAARRLVEHEAQHPVDYFPYPGANLPYGTQTTPEE